MVTTVLYQKNGFEQLELNKFVVFVSRAPKEQREMTQSVITPL